MVKINIVTLERDNIIRTKTESEAEVNMIRSLFTTNEQGLIVRLDLTDSSIARFKDNKIFHKSFEAFYDTYKETNRNLVTEELGFNLLGLLTSNYMDSNVEKKSKELEEILDNIEKTTALFGYDNTEEDETFKSVFDTIRKGFVTYNPNKNIANGKRDFITVKGIPDLTIVLCTPKNRKEQDLELLKTYLREDFISKSTAKLTVENVLFKGINEELEALNATTDALLNICNINLIDTSEVNKTKLETFVTDLKAQKTSLLSVLHVINALGGAEIIMPPDVIKKELKDIKTLSDLMKLTCII